MRASTLHGWGPARSIPASRCRDGSIAHVGFGGPIEGGFEFALLYAAMPVGAVLGGVFGGWISRVHKQGTAVLWAVAVWGGSIALMGLAVGLASWQTQVALGFALGMLVIGGAADMISSAFRQSILLSATDDAVRGRMQGVFTPAGRDSRTCCTALRPMSSGRSGRPQAAAYSSSSAWC